MKAIILAGMSAITLCACTTTQAAPVAFAPEVVLASPVEFRIVPLEEIAAGQPTLAPGGNVTAYVAAYMSWIAEPGHLVERSVLFASGEPPGLPDDADFVAIIDELAGGGHAGATLMRDSGNSVDLLALAEKGEPTAKLALAMNNITVGSLQQKVDALMWLRAQATENSDAAFALGSVLLSQTSDGGMMEMSLGGAATPGEVREGAALLVEVARAAPLDIMGQIGAMMATHAGVDPAVDRHARKVLELVVASTHAVALPEPDMSALEDEDAYRQFDAQMQALQSAVEARIHLAGMLRNGQGGPADPEQAKALYGEALDAAQDYRAYAALSDMGVDVSEYDALFGDMPPGGDDWWDVAPGEPGIWGEEPEIVPPPHEH